MPAVFHSWRKGEHTQKHNTGLGLAKQNVATTPKILMPLTRSKA